MYKKKSLAEGGYNIVKRGVEDRPTEIDIELSNNVGRALAGTVNYTPDVERELMSRFEQDIQTVDAVSENSEEHDPLLDPVFPSGWRTPAWLRAARHRRLKTIGEDDLVKIEDAELTLDD